MKKIQDNKGFTLIELLIVVAIIGIIAAIAVPGLLRARMSGNEASAIGSMRAINTAQQNYSQQCHGYAPLLTELKAAGNYLSPDMTSGATVAKSGYNITLAAGAGNAVLATQAPGCTASGTNYYASAVHGGRHDQRHSVSTKSTKNGMASPRAMPFLFSVEFSNQSAAL